MSEATERVRMALLAGQLPARKDWSHFLRDQLGISKSRAEAFAAQFVKAGLIEDVAPADAETIAAAERLLKLISSR